MNKESQCQSLRSLSSSPGAGLCYRGPGIFSYRTQKFKEEELRAIQLEQSAEQQLEKRALLVLEYRDQHRLEHHQMEERDQEMLAQEQVREIDGFVLVKLGTIIGDKLIVKSKNKSSFRRNLKSKKIIFICSKKDFLNKSNI